MSYEIKKLEWNEQEDGVLNTPDGLLDYQIDTNGNDKDFSLGCFITGKDGIYSSHTTLEEAKAAAQAHYENEVKKHLVEVE